MGSGSKTFQDFPRGRLIYLVDTNSGSYTTGVLINIHTAAVVLGVLATQTSTGCSDVRGRTRQSPAMRLSRPPVGWERAVTRGTAGLFVNGGAGGCAFMSEVRWTAIALQARGMTRHQPRISAKHLSTPPVIEPSVPAVLWCLPAPTQNAPSTPRSHGFGIPPQVSRRKGSPEDIPVKRPAFKPIQREHDRPTQNSRPHIHRVPNLDPRHKSHLVSRINDFQIRKLLSQSHRKITAIRFLTRQS